MNDYESEMFDTLKKILEQAPADYADVRYETMRQTVIGFVGKELTTVGTNTTDGFVVRVFKAGGFAAVAFTRQEDANSAVRAALENASLFSRNAKKPVRLAPAPAVSATVKPDLPEDPRTVPIEEKLALLRRYNDIPLGSPAVVTTGINYSETSREKYFASTEGTRIREDLVTTIIGGLITTGDGTLTQNIRVGIGGSHGFGAVRDRETHFLEQTKMAVDLLKARPVKSGVYHCVLNPDLAGVFAHEAFGHFSEADIVQSLPAMREKMRIGAELGGPVLSITDDPTRPRQLGFYVYDDEGVKSRPVPLIKNGILAGRLHSRRTAAEFGEPVTGHCVAEDYRYAPIVRMGTIFIQPGADTLESLLAKLDDGLYLLDAKGGQTAGETFTFGANYGYLVRGGKRGPMVRGINISGNLYETLKDITAVGNDLELAETGGCGKGQTNIRSCHGAPHVLINHLLIGGV